MKKIPVVHIVLFIATFLSTMLVGAFHEGVITFREPFSFSITRFSDLQKGLPFSLTLMGILLVHEFAHYATSRRHRIRTSLPYFLPAPTQFGTFGAFITMRSPITTKNVLVDIGASGPIAGFLLSVVATIIGLRLSTIVPMHAMENEIAYGGSLLYFGLISMVIGRIPEHHVLSLHAVAFAGWIGLFVTSLNLIPVGQLDGGHIAYALLGERHKWLSRLLVLLMSALGLFVFLGWLVWAMLLLILGTKHPPILYPEIPLDNSRRTIGLIALLILIVTFIPVPAVIL